MAQGPMSSILVTIWITVRIHESEVQNLHSLDYRKSYKRILTKFYGQLGCGLENNWLHFGDDPHHYPDPGVRFQIREELPRCQHTQNRCPAKIIQQLHYASVRRRSVLSWDWVHLGRFSTWRTGHLHTSGRHHILCISHSITHLWMWAHIYSFFWI